MCAEKVTLSKHITRIAQGIRANSDTAQGIRANSDNAQGRRANSDIA